MNPIEEIQKRLEKYPQAKFEVQNNCIVILSMNDQGFAVSLQDHGESYTLSFDGWHEEFDEPSKALEAFAFGLSESCRLEVLHRGRFPYVWTVEEKQNDEWINCEWIGLNQTGLLAPPLFWLPKRVVYLQNHLIKDEPS